MRVTLCEDWLTPGYRLPKIDRFSASEEDEPPAHLLLSDYGIWLA